MSNHQKDAMIGGTIVVGGILFIIGMILTIAGIWTTDMRWAYTGAIPSGIGVTLIIIGWRAA